MFKSKFFSMENAIDEIYSESVVDSSLKPGQPYFEPGCSEATKNKNIKIPTNIRDTQFKSSIEKPKKKGKKPSFYEEDAEEMPMDTIKAKIVELFDDFTNASNGILFDNLLANFKSKYRFKNSSRYISRALQELFNKEILTFDDKSKKIFIVQNDEDEEEIDDLDKVNSSLKDEIIDFFDTSASGSVSGITLRDINKEFKNKYSKEEIITTIKGLIKNNILVKGPAEGTLIINSIDADTEEDDEGSLIPSSNLNSQKPDDINSILSNTETPETLKQKGWREVDVNIFMSPDGKQKYVVNQDKNKINESFKINNFMSKSKEYDYNALVFEAAQIIDDIEVDDNLDNTAGLDEFEPTDDIDDSLDDLDSDGETVDIEITKSELKTIAPILRKMLDIVDAEEADDTEDSDLADLEEPVDDLATDEGNTEDLFSDEDEEDEDYCSKKCMEEEDEETPADDTASGVYDGSASLSQPATTRKHTVKYDRSGNPIKAKAYTTRPGQADDCAQSVSGGPKMTKTTPPFDRNGNPVRSKVTTGAASKKSYWEI